MTNDNPKVTLLRKATCVHTVIFGRKKCAFTGGVPTMVRPAIALYLKNQKKEDGSNLFKVTDLPTIVESAKATTAVVVKATKTPKEVSKPRPKQNVLGNILVQRTLKECIS